jgi:hypothetical protein
MSELHGVNTLTIIEIHLLHADRNIHKTEEKGSENLNQTKNRKEEKKNKLDVSIKVTGLYPNTLTNK